MYNVYSPVIQQMGIMGLPPNASQSQHGFEEFMNPPTYQGSGDYNPLIQTADPSKYNYGPTIGAQPIPYDQMRNQAAYNLQQQMANPMWQTYGYGGYPQYYQPYYPQQQQTVQVVQGFNPLGVQEVQSADYDQRKHQIEEFYEDAAKKDMDERYGGYTNTYNYYGYYNTNYVDPNIIEGYQSAKSDLEHEGIQNRINLNMRLSRQAHAYKGDLEQAEEYIGSIYEDRKVYSPAIDYSEIYQAQSLENAVDITAIVKQRIAEADQVATSRHNKFVNPNSDIVEYMDNAGMLLWDDWQSKATIAARSRERFSDGEFKQFMNSQLQRRQPGGDNAFEALMRVEGVNLLDDGTIDIKFPGTMQKNEYSLSREPITNEMQSTYEQQRYAFVNAIYNKGGSNLV